MLELIGSWCTEHWFLTFLLVAELLAIPGEVARGVGKAIKQRRKLLEEKRLGDEASAKLVQSFKEREFHERSLD